MLFFCFLLSVQLKEKLCYTAEMKEKQEAQTEVICGGRAALISEKHEHG